jgi:hypothetical protein
MKASGSLTISAVVLLFALACHAEGKRDDPALGRESRRFAADSVRTRGTGGDDLTIFVAVDIYFESPTGLFVYNYTITNATYSANVLETFAVSPCNNVQYVEGPDHWLGFDGYQGDSLAVVWRAVGDEEDPIPWDGLTITPSARNLAPGETIGGFIVRSPLSGSYATFYARGFEEIPDGAETVEEHDPLPPKIYEAGLRGDTYAPSLPPSLGAPGDSARSDGSVELGLVRPNPSRGEFTIALWLPRGGLVDLSVYDVGGRLVRRVSRGREEAGLRTFHWNGTDRTDRRVSPGVYVYLLLVDGVRVAERRLVVLR